LTSVINQRFPDAT